MKYSEAIRGRTFILRLEDKEVLHEVVEKFAVDKDIQRATVQVIGGADEGSRLVVGPREARSNPVEPMDHYLDGACEIAGVGTLFPNASGKPVLHLHIACGREDKTVTGCVRRGVKVWHLMEVVILELVNATATRMFDSETGFELLQP